jgi:hypothetical protein
MVLAVYEAHNLSLQSTERSLVTLFGIYSQFFKKGSGRPNINSCFDEMMRSLSLISFKLALKYGMNAVNILLLYTRGVRAVVGDPSIGTGTRHM